MSANLPHPGADPAAGRAGFAEVIPELVPWRERAHEDAVVHALVSAGATDAEAADVLAAEVTRLMRQLNRLLTTSTVPSVLVLR